MHFSFMPAFPASKRSRKRRSGTIRSVAIELGIHERTLRRWISRPELRPNLRAYRHGRQRRLDIQELILRLRATSETCFAPSDHSGGNARKESLR